MKLSACVCVCVCVCGSGVCEEGVVRSSSVLALTYCDVRYRKETHAQIDLYRDVDIHMCVYICV